jgi:hypothetical protein
VGKPLAGKWLFVAVLAVVVAVGFGVAARAVYGKPVKVVKSAVALPPSDPVASGEPGPSIVEFAGDALTHPLSEPVRVLLQNHFDSINERDYARWATTVTSRRIEDLPEDKWQLQYQTTKDGSIGVYRLEHPQPDQARVMVQFISVQDPEDAPPTLREPCIRWQVIYPLIKEDGAWRIDGGAAWFEKC